MSREEIKPIISVCEGCLATDRKLTNLGKYSDLFYKLHCATVDQDFREPLMCWECKSVFNKISKFCDQVTKAQCVLKTKYENERPQYKCLSTLNKTFIIGYDFEIVYQETESVTQNYDAYVKLERINHIINEELEIDNIKEKKAHRLLTYESHFNDHGDHSDLDNKDINLCETTVFGQKDEIGDVKDENNDWKYEKCDDDNSKNEDTNSSKVVERDRNGARKKRKQIHYRYRVINMASIHDTSKLYRTQQIDKEEALNFFKKEQEEKNHFTHQFSCEICFSGFPSEEKLTRHHKKFHSTTVSYRTCEICKKTFKTHSEMQRHFYLHSKKFECLLCEYTTYSRSSIYKHLNYFHRKVWECVKCQMRFPSSNRREFHKHYRNLHMFYICHHCGKKVGTRNFMKNHLRVFHTEPICKECNITFKHHKHLQGHIKLKHTTQVSEETYCVECDKQFVNVMKYKNHIKSSIKHRPRVKQSFSCPDCGKIYLKHIAMQNHYNLVHQKQSKYFCDECSKYFLNGFQLRRHIASFHNKIRPPKNKMCPYCDRGFSTNRILEHHIRTHTGERPYSCDFCSASFAQQTALKTHVKSIHQKNLSGYLDK